MKIGLGQDDMPFWLVPVIHVTLDKCSVYTLQFSYIVSNEIMKRKSFESDKLFR